ncbi:DUF2306 domain-containing protein [Bradyrhizobium sp. Arg314]
MRPMRQKVSSGLGLHQDVTPRGTSLVCRGAWIALTISATLVGVASLRYALPTVPFPVVENFVTHRTALVVHAVSASIALLVGPWQFLTPLRQRRPWLHRYGGRTYALAVLIAWLASIPVALHAETGTVASVGFLALGVVWVATTAVGVFLILRRRTALHRRWMIRSYALTAAAITLRIYLGLAGAMNMPFIEAYPVIAWLCWVPNLLFAEIVLHRSRDKLSWSKLESPL